MPHTLYQKAIMRHAAKAVGAGSLAAPNASVTLDNPLCGDRVTLDVTLDGGTIGALAHRLHACVLCQASASILAETAIGKQLPEIERVATELRAMLKAGGPAPAGDWAPLAVFEPAIKEKNRHHCVLLPFDALIKALRTS